MTIELTVNWIAVIAASIISFLIGFIWFGVLFMDRWSKLVGLPKNFKEPHPIRTMFIGFFVTLLSVYILALFIVNTGSTTAIGGMTIGLLIWLGCSIAANAGPVLWEKKPIGLLWLGLPYELINLLLAGGILGYWL